jgi:hypothetical protein
MSKETKTTVMPTTLDHIEEIIYKAKELGLNTALFQKAKPQLKAVAEALKLTESQACLFSLVLENAGSEPVSIGEIAEMYKSGRIQLLKYMDDFEALEKKRMIRPSHNWEHTVLRRRRKSRDSLPSYTVPLDVIKAVRQGSPYRDTTYFNLDPDDFYAAANELFDACRDGNIGTETLIEELKSLFAGNPNIAFLKNLKTHLIKFKDAALLLCFSCAWIEDDIDTLSLSRLNFIFGARTMKFLARRFKTNEHPLIEKGLLEAACDNGLTDGETYSLTLKAHETFLSDINLSERKRRSGRNIIRTTDINERRLFHPGKIKTRIDELSELLSGENFSRIKKRLVEMNMRTAFTCIFSGPPGTGKTETACQIALATGRDIFLVDIADTKSMWFGESEKRIKAIFDRYKGMLRGSVLAPILLFNEADAVLGKRQELNENRRGGPAHTENAIQNIILQEMENLEGGILIATTNMKNNLDKAFERRFLYKLEFEKPDLQTAALIWQNFLPELCKEAAATLARRFDFSGGQIENISRKCAVDFVLSGSSPSLDKLTTFCNEELLYKDTGFKIGFNTNEQ